MTLLHLLGKFNVAALMSQVRQSWDPVPQRNFECKPETCAGDSVADHVHTATAATQRLSCSQSQPSRSEGCSKGWRQHQRPQAQAASCVTVGLRSVGAII
jgi:hypothetical protein